MVKKQFLIVKQVFYHNSHFLKLVKLASGFLLDKRSVIAWKRQKIVMLF